MALMPVRLVRTVLTGVFVAALVTAGAPVAATAQAAGRNLVANPSAETISRGVPKGWSKGSTGVNRSSLSVVAKGGKSGARFVRTRITSYTSGGAWWATPAVAVRAGATYTMTEYYRSGAATRVLAAATVRGKVVWLSLGTAKPATVWTAASFTVTAPAGATSLRLAHSLRSVGQLDVDAVSLVLAKAAPAPSAPAAPVTGGAVRPATTVPAASGKGLVSITFDDGTADHYTNALPVLKRNGQVGTFYLISGYLGATNYVTVDQAKQLQAAGNEIGSHTVNHPQLTTLGNDQLESQFGDSKRALEANFGPVTSLAYPYGASNATVRQIAAKYYASARSTDGGPNVTGQYDRYRLTIGYVLNTTSLDTIKQWIADAQAKNTWLILCYHGVSDGKPGEVYNVSVGDFSAQLAAVKAAGVRVATVRDALHLTGN